MAAAVRPTVAISICRVLMMESAVMIGFRALDARALELGTGAAMRHLQQTPGRGGSAGGTGTPWVQTRRADHRLTRLLFRAWCADCVEGRTKDNRHLGKTKPLQEKTKLKNIKEIIKVKDLVVKFVFSNI